LTCYSFPQGIFLLFWALGALIAKIVNTNLSTALPAFIRELLSYDTFPLLGGSLWPDATLLLRHGRSDCDSFLRVRLQDKPFSLFAYPLLLQYSGFPLFDFYTAFFLRFVT